MYLYGKKLTTFMIESLLSNLIYDVPMHSVQKYPSKSPSSFTLVNTNVLSNNTSKLHRMSCVSCSPYAKRQTAEHNNILLAQAK